MKNDNGHTLIELVFVIALIGISFPGLLSFFTNNMVDSINNEITSKAIVLSRNKMEQITADKRERGIDYVSTPYRYPAENISQFTRFVTVKKHTVGGIDGIEVTISISHSLLTSDYSVTQFFVNHGVN